MMDKRYIEKDDALRIINDELNTRGVKKPLINAFNRIVDLPAADVEEVRHGEWKKISDNVVRCSACGSFTSIGDLLGTSNSIIIGKINPRCRICGAKMDGGKE